MKSYLRFLERNKLYTAIEVVGLSVSLAFVVLMSSYVISNTSYDKEIKNKGDIYICHNKNCAYSFTFLDKEFDKYPEIIDYCQLFHATNTVKVNGENVNAAQLVVSDNFFEFLPYKLKYGNPEDVFAASNSAVISESFASRIFPGEDPIGRTIEYSTTQDISIKLTVTGIFKDVRLTHFMDKDVIIQVDTYKEGLGSSAQGWTIFANLVRLQNGTDLKELADKIYDNSDEVIFAYNLAQRLDFTCLADLDMNIGSFTEPFVNLGDKSLQKKFTLAAIILLLFSILNYIFLTIAFSRFRLKEMATRMVLGTSRLKAAGQMVLESLLLTSVSFCFGLLLAMALEGPASLVLRSDVDVFGMWTEAITGAAIIICISLISGIVPALSSVRIDPIATIKGEARLKNKLIFGRIFIIIQSCISVVILSFAAVMYLQTKFLIDAPLGYHTDGLLHAYEWEEFDVRKTLEELPFVESVSNMVGFPSDISVMARTSIEIAKESLSANVLFCDKSALSELGIEVLKTVNQDGAYKGFYVTESSYEQMLNLCKSKGLDEGYLEDRIPGIVSEFRFGNITSDFDGAITAVVFQDMDQLGGLLIKVSCDVHEAANEIRRIAEGKLGRPLHDNELNIGSDLIEESFRNEKNATMIIGAFSLLCILLSMMGVVALSSYHGQINTRDTAVRKVFGMSRRNVFAKTVWTFVFPALIGSVVAVPVAYYLIERWLQDYPVRIDIALIVYPTVVALVLVVVIVAVILQALRLMRTNPAEALKKE